MEYCYPQYLTQKKHANHSDRYPEFQPKKSYNYAGGKANYVLRYFFNVVPAQRQAEIKEKKKIILCEYCGRILADVIPEKVVEKPKKRTTRKKATPKKATAKKAAAKK